ncbi:MAG: hypothetical protein ACREE6_18995, partial [Limisphaerales bacterium]
MSWSKNGASPGGRALPPGAERGARDTVTIQRSCPEGASLAKISEAVKQFYNNYKNVAPARCGFTAARLALTFGVALFFVSPPGNARAGALPGRSSGSSEAPRMRFIQDDDIRLGVDLNLGGAITYLAPMTNLSLNLINRCDWGREIQLSYYSGPVPYQPPGTTLAKNWKWLGWNPIQAGDD